MEMRPLETHAADPMAAWNQAQRMSEPWFITKMVAIVGSLLFAMVLGYLAATGQIELLIVVAVWVVACMVIVFVREYWWAPALVVTALMMSTYAAGFKLTGLEVGMAILALTFPIKMAMKTLWPVRPKMEAGPIYWALVIFVAIHAVVILFYNKIEGVPELKNIIKAYYGALAPLVLYGMLLRYCDPKTVVPTCMTVYFLWIFTVLVSVPVVLLGVQAMELTSLRINLDFLDAGGAIGSFRMSGPYIFTASVAAWPAARTQSRRALLGFGVVAGFICTLMGGSRVSAFSVFLAAGFFAVARRKLWLALPTIVLVAVMAAVFTFKPDLMFSMPETAQRSLAFLNFSDEKTDIQSSVGESDRWHQELREDSIPYWFQDTTSFFLGHGFKSWDDTITVDNVTFDVLKQRAIEMGITENMFSSITNIFGLAGLVLYGAFLLELAWRLWNARAACPDRSLERAICEFSFVVLVSDVVLAPFNGGTPGIVLIYWAMGLLAARPYIGIREKAVPAPAPAFDRSRQALAVSRRPTGNDPLAAFASRHHRFPSADNGDGSP